MREPPITIEFLLACYASGYFPMAESRHGERIGWCNPDIRAILPLEGFHISQSLVKTLRKQPFEICLNTDFRQVITACAEPTEKRKESWINDELIALYCELASIGFAHSVECWQDGELVGGIYGVALGGAFFGESMFSRVPNASKVALAYLVSLLKTKGYKLLDAQFPNPHLAQFGLQEIPREDYMHRLREALQAQVQPLGR